MTRSDRRISARQNEPRFQQLLKAASASHVRGQRIEAARVSISLALAGAGLLAALLNVSATPFAAAGFTWAAAYALLIGPSARREARRGAVVQEMFDTELFALPWNQTLAGDPWRPDQVSALAARFVSTRGREDALRNWYVKTDRLPHSYAVLLCQYQNLGWDVELRRRWSTILGACVVAWVVLGLIVGYALDLTVSRTLTLWFVPSLGAFLYGVEGFLGQRDIAAERDRILSMVAPRLKTTEVGDEAEFRNDLRRVQDVIFATRKQAIRVPQWFYARHRAEHERIFVRLAKDMHKKFQP